MDLTVDKYFITAVFFRDSSTFATWQASILIFWPCMDALLLCFPYIDLCHNGNGNIFFSFQRASYGAKAKALEPGLRLKYLCSFPRTGKFTTMECASTFLAKPLPTFLSIPWNELFFRHSPPIYKLSSLESPLCRLCLAILIFESYYRNTNINADKKKLEEIPEFLGCIPTLAVQRIE